MVSALTDVNSMEHRSLESDRSLIDVNFDGYKLSSSTLDHASLSLKRYGLWFGIA